MAAVQSSSDTITKSPKTYLYDELIICAKVFATTGRGLTYYFTCSFVNSSNNSVVKLLISSMMMKIVNRCWLFKLPTFSMELPSDYILFIIKEFSCSNTLSYSSVAPRNTKSWALRLFCKTDRHCSLFSSWTWKISRQLLFIFQQNCAFLYSSWNIEHLKAVFNVEDAHGILNIIARS